MAGNQLLVLMQRVGWLGEFQSWTYTPVSLQNGSWVAKPTQNRSLNVAAGRTFSYELMIVLGEWWHTTIQAGACVFDEVKLQMPRSSAGLGPRDLLCYLCLNESD